MWGIPQKPKKPRSKSFHFNVRIVPPEAYPDLKDNPENPFTEISEDERMADFVEILGLIWAETCKENAFKTNDKSSCDYKDNKYHDTRKNPEIANGEETP